ncbi:hypothetical protein ABZP36_017137 [Zizania latifolia]
MNRASNFMPTPDQDVLEVKPLRTLAPMFPAPLGVNVVNQSKTPPLVFAAPAGQFPGFFGALNHPEVRSFATFGGHDQDVSGGKPVAAVGDDAGGGQIATFGDQETSRGQFAANGTPNIDVNATEPIDATPISAYKSTQPSIISLDDDDENDYEPYAGNQTSASERKIKRSSHLSGYNMNGNLDSDNSNGTKIKRPKSSHRKAAADNELSLTPPSSNPREIVEVILMTFEALRRRHLQLDETQETSKRADLKAGAIMMASNLRANIGKRIGTVPGVEIGDIFYFRMELCIIGLHAPSMGGIDYMNAKFGDEDDSVAICIVAAGVYENNDDDTDTLVYSGSGGISKNNEDRHDQKLERGNLALERSLSRKNVIRVVRGYKDPACLTGKVYIYDGLYKIHESWKEKTKTGINCFKYKLQRESGQPDGVAIWKMSQRWIENPSARGSVLHSDLSCGAENLPVLSMMLIARKDHTTSPILLSCVCAQHNGGDLSYSSSGLLVCRKLMTVCPGEKTLKWNYGPELIREQEQITNISADTFEPLPIKISAKKMGNISRFMNHSCAPNVFWQPVQFDHGDDDYPHIMFFALKHIPPMTELTYDYGDIGAESSGVGSNRAKKCLCGFSNCRGYFS